MKYSKYYLGKMIEEKQRNEGLLGTIFILMGNLRWGRGDNATGIQPIDFGKVRSLDFRGQVPIWCNYHIIEVLFVVGGHNRTTSRAFRVGSK